jgi:hypothetical protein
MVVNKRTAGARRPWGGGRGGACSANSVRWKGATSPTALKATPCLTTERLASFQVEAVLVLDALAVEAYVSVHWHAGVLTRGLRDTTCHSDTLALIARVRGSRAGGRRRWAWCRGLLAILFAISWCVEGPTVILDAVVVGCSDTSILCCDGWRQRRGGFAQLFHALVAYLIGEDGVVAAPNIAWIRPLPTHELASRKRVPTNDAVVVLPAVARHLARCRGWCGGASCVCAGLLRVEAAALVLLASASQDIAAVFGGDALGGLRCTTPHRVLNPSAAPWDSHQGRCCCIQSGS